MPTDLHFDGRQLNGLDRINVLLGKNGSGKSRLLRDLESNKDALHADITYISPERAGRLEYEQNVYHQIRQNENWLRNERRRNMVENFMQQAFAHLAHIELKVLRIIEREKRGDTSYTMDNYIQLINSLLDQIELRRDDKSSFTLHYKNDGRPASAAQLSSGESQIIALGIECLAFELEMDPTKPTFLVLDEPDVHIHPDLQEKFVKYIVKMVERTTLNVIIATHSTAIMGALSNRADARVCFMKAGLSQLQFAPVTESLRKILPVFGAHPLSNVFNELPILLVEGSDEERVWQQAVRTSLGRIRFYSCECGGITNMEPVEREADAIIQSVYDNGTGYSLRDRDDSDGTISDIGVIERFRLQWRASENLMLTDEVLANWGTDWTTLQSRLSTWVAQNNTHPYWAEAKAFVDGGFNRETADLKDIRNILAAQIATKSWEVIVGQAIGKLNPAGYVRGRAGTLHAALGDPFFTVVFGP